MAEIGRMEVVAPPAVEKLPAPINPPEVPLVEPMMWKAMFAWLAP
jgi:hypothetical protein